MSSKDEALGKTGVRRTMCGTTPCEHKSSDCDTTGSWLCGARECSMINTIVKPLSAQVFCVANRVARHSRYSSCSGSTLITETVFLLAECRHASERQELAHDSRWPPVCCPEPEVADLVFECPFICGLGTSVLVTHSCVPSSSPVLFPW